MSRKKPPTGNNPRANPAVRYAPADLLVGRPLAYAVAGGRLIVDPGWVRVGCRLRRNPDPAPEEYPLDTVSCLVRLADASGGVWETESTFGLPVLLEPIGSLEHYDPVAFFDDAPDAWKVAFADDPMVAGAGCLLDDRFYRSILVGDRRVDLKFKYQYPTFDVALNPTPSSPTSTSLIVRVSQLRDLESDEIPPLVYSLGWYRVMFRNDLYFDEAGACWEEGGLPLPTVFRKVDAGGPPQALVRYERG